MKNNTERKLRQIESCGLIVGVDPHKRMHAAVIMTKLNVICSKVKIANSRQGFEYLVERARAEATKAAVSGVIFAIEAGGHYWRNLAYYLDEQGLDLYLINPFTLKRQREGKDLDRRKNDYRDAETAAQLLRNGDFTETRLLQGDYAELRALHMARQRLREELSRNINLLRGLLDGLFPEFCQVFKDPCCKSAIGVLSTCPSPREIASLKVEEFIQKIRLGGVQRPALKKLRALHELASSSVGVKVGTEGVKEELGLLIQRRHLFVAQMDEVERKLHELLYRFEESKYLLSVPGLSETIVCGLIANIGPLKHYGEAKDLVKLAGVNPTQNESADKGKHYTPISKKGRSDLRRCLWQAAMSVLRFNDNFKAWAKGMESRPAHANPLHHREVLGAAMNKLLRLYFALLSKGQMYSPAEAAKAATAA